MADADVLMLDVFVWMHASKKSGIRHRHVRHFLFRSQRFHRVGHGCFDGLEANSQQRDGNSQQTC